MGSLYQTLLYQPLFNLLVFFYNFIPGRDIGLAIIALTILIKILLFPISRRSLKQQKALQALQPKLEELKEKYKDSKEKLARATMEFYKQEKVNPLSSCLPVLIQLPFLIAVYQVFQVGLMKQDFSILYPFITNPGQIDTVSFGIIDWAQARTIPGLALSVLAGAGQYISTKMLVTKKPPFDSKGNVPEGARDESMLAAMNKQMLYFMPILTVVIGYSLPTGLVLYWLTLTAMTLLQQKHLLRAGKNT